MGIILMPIRIRIGIKTMPILVLEDKSYFPLLITHCQLQCFIFLIIVKYVIIFKIFHSIFKFSGTSFSNFFICQIRIGIPWMPILIRKMMRIRIYNTVAR
jgi:hypothetical protein